MGSIWRTDRGCAVADDPDFAVYAYLGNGNSKSNEHDKEGERNAKRDDFLGTGLSNCMAGASNYENINFVHFGYRDRRALCRKLNVS